MRCDPPAGAHLLRTAASRQSRNSISWSRHARRFSRLSSAGRVLLTRARGPASSVGSGVVGVELQDKFKGYLRTTSVHGSKSAASSVGTPRSAVAATTRGRSSTSSGATSPTRAVCHSQSALGWLSTCCTTSGRGARAGGLGVRVRLPRADRAATHGRGLLRLPFRLPGVARRLPV